MATNEQVQKDYEEAWRYLEYDIQKAKDHSAGIEYWEARIKKLEGDYPWLKKKLSKQQWTTGKRSRFLIKDL